MRQSQLSYIFQFKSQIRYFNLITSHNNYQLHFIMSSLASLFEKRAKQNKQSTLSSLFTEDKNKKFQNLAVETNASNVVYLPPAPKKDQPENLQATIFVGNVPVTYTQKNLKNIFKEYGRIQKVWFRSVPVEQNKLGKRGNYILKNFQEGADSMNGYVKFTEKESAKSACAANGTKVDEHTLRVSMCLDNNLDYDKTLFVGNLPFDIQQEELRQHFQSFGAISNVRVVKDRNTRKGIGIGYVKYVDKQEMFKALHSLNGSILKQRQIRVKRAVEKGRLEKKVRKVMEKKLNKKGYTPPQNLMKAFGNQNQFNRNSNPNVGSDDPNEQKKQQARKFHFKRKMIKK